MSSERLREAARLMRERATDALGPDWEWAVDEDGDGQATWWAFTDEDHLSANGILTARDLPQWTDRLTLWEHITGWSPAVALAVADWLETTADENDSPAGSSLEFLNFASAESVAALAVADAYLGSDR